MHEAIHNAAHKAAQVVAESTNQKTDSTTNQESMIDNAIKFQNMKQGDEQWIETGRHVEITESEITEEARLMKIYNRKYKGVTATQFSSGIDHIEAQDEELKCPELWIMNGQPVSGCITNWRTDKRPWCSIDEIFQGKFIFCPETDQEKEKREKELEAAKMFRNGIDKMNGYDTRKSIIQAYGQITTTIT